jgi:GNAT superfamily N-acetyltransferase
VNSVRFPEDFLLERLRRDHPRTKFDCGEDLVNDWLATKALQNQDKHLSVTKVILDDAGAIAGYFTLATGLISFSDLPAEFAKRLPKRMLPVAVLAWLGVNRVHQGGGLGERLLGQALRDCWEASRTFAFIAVIVDCVDDSAKAFYCRWEFGELPGHPHRLYLGAEQLETMMMES